MPVPSDLPVACSLDAPELTERLAEMAAIGRAGLLESRVDDRRASLRFRAPTHERLARVVAAEAECCPFLNMKLDGRAGEVQLTIDAPEGTETVLHDLVAAFQR